MEYNVNELFYDDNDYINKAEWCNKNQEYTIAEVTPDENGRRRFKFVKRISSEKELINIELATLNKWYDNYYLQHEQKYRRLHSLGKLTDEGKDAYQELINLYNEAEIKRARIQELERLLSDSSK